MNKKQKIIACIGFINNVKSMAKLADCEIPYVYHVLQNIGQPIPIPKYHRTIRYFYNG